MERFPFSVFQFCQERKLVLKGDRIIVSLSGGIDSMSLFCLLHSFQERLDFEIHLLHFNHGLREESQSEAEFLTDLARRRDTPITIIETTRLKGKSGMQNEARKWRYAQLNDHLHRLGFNKIALGHHLDDLVETQIWKMMRGGSLYTLSPMRLINLPYIRPLLHLRKEALKAYLLTIDQTWREDSSNFKDDYTRNMIRHQLIPVMRQCAGDGFEEKFLALSEDSEELRQLFDQRVPAERYERSVISYETIRQLEPIFAKELIHRFLIFHNQREINRSNIEQIYALTLSGKGNWRISLKDNRTVLGKNRNIEILFP